uniref:Zinc finger protein 703 n=1 Tax=Anthurium amnicola TaxID=1678845 RepID=A0A1D1ZKQ7_9ARAE
MPLEDFFTLTEMKDGLATLPRVEELLSVMKIHKDSYSDNLGDASRQWTTVASILSATENKDCLNHFVQLNGLLFLNCWLEEAQRWDVNNSDYVDELINAMLGALDRLPVDKEKSSASGIGLTIKHLLCYSSHSIQERVRTLLNKWDHAGDTDLRCQNVEEHETSCDDESKPSTKIRMAENVQSINPAPEVPTSDKDAGDIVKIYSDSSSVDTIKEGKLSSSHISPHHNLHSSDVYVVSGEISSLASSIVSYPCQESFGVAKESVCPAARVASAGTCISSISGGKFFDDGSDISSKKDVSDGPNEMETEESMKEFSPTKSLERERHTGSEMETSFHKDDIGTAGDSKEVESDPKSKVRRGLDSIISCAAFKPEVDASISETDRRSEIGLGYSEIDALDVARQVAIEVEREVVGYREPFCSSPEGILRGKKLDSGSPDIAESNDEKPVSGQLNVNEPPCRKDLSEESVRNSSRTSEIVNNKDAHELESPKSSLIQESGNNADKKMCDFDLNEDIYPEEADCSIGSAPNQNIKISVPIPVAASKGSPGLPVIPIHFQGTLGWRGSAATSAFRPASPWRASDGEKTVSGPKQRSNFLRIDLNVVEDDIAADQLEKQTPVSSSIPSSESSMEVSSRRAERLKLDLNRLGDEDTLPDQSPFWRPHLRNANRSPSPASSSSSRQPSMKYFDLNDNPSLFDACGSNSHSKASQERSTYGSYMVNDSVTTTMGLRMLVEQKVLVNETPQPFFGNGLFVDPAISVRGPVPYHPMPPPSFGHNGLIMGPAISIPSTFCGPGPIPYMIDSRGTTVIPQILGSVGLRGAPSARAPFVMNLVGAPSGLNAAGVSQPTLDLNSGTTAAGGEGKTVGNYKHFMQGSSVLMEEQMRSASQPAGLGMALKRKEPDCGWEPCTFGYKQVTSWQ